MKKEFAQTGNFPARMKNFGRLNSGEDKHRKTSYNNGSMSPQNKAVAESSDYGANSFSKGRKAAGGSGVRTGNKGRTGDHEITSHEQDVSRVTS